MKKVIVMKGRGKLMDDLIGRQAAIDLLDAVFENAFDTLCKLPTAEKKGKWIDGFESGFDGVRHWFRECSECEFARKDDNPDLDSNYCPNCGARMEESDE